MSGHSTERSYAVVAETRRKWSAAERKQIVAETETSTVSSVSRKHNVAASLVFRWRREAGMPGKKSARRPQPAFAAVTLALPPPAPAFPAPGPDSGMIEIELSGGSRIRVTGAVETEALKRVIAALSDR